VGGWENFQKQKINKNWVRGKEKIKFQKKKIKGKKTRKGA
jgi:hypothetical protein